MMRAPPFTAPIADRRSVAFLTALALVAVAAPLLNLAVPESSPLHLSSYAVGLIGKYLCYAMLALAVDFIWGFAGILSLGHAAFFALGG
ncbi:MAG: urea ABC transporter permease subunit UrtC, partial [Acidobacteria bacterium]|nr:urea ABC transporter permease subunit UrtC [Acidobacteriota bacterium]